MKCTHATRITQSTIYVLLWIVCSSATGEPPVSSEAGSAGPISLNEQAMDSITAGSVSSTTNVQAHANSPVFAETATRATTYAVIGERQALPAQESFSARNDFILQSPIIGESPIAAVGEWRERLADAPGSEKFGWTPMLSRFDRHPDPSFPLPRDGWHTGGEGRSTARSNGRAITEGTSTSVAGSIGLRVSGRAEAFGDRANASTTVSTRGIDTGRVQIVIGRVSSVACCGKRSDTNVEARTFAPGRVNFNQVILHKIDTPQMSRSIGNAIIVSTPFR